jgi:DOMON domain
MLVNRLNPKPMKILKTLFFAISMLNCSYANVPKIMKSITKNGMKVSWEYKNQRIYFEMTAPTNGWVAIGFNNSDNTAGNYLLMGNVVGSQSSVMEHYTISAGNYKSFTDLKVNISVFDVVGIETQQVTKIRFSLPTAPSNKYTKDLEQGQEYTLLMAYSQQDDFQHHSIMRTSVKIIL